MCTNFQYYFIFCIPISDFDKYTHAHTGTHKYTQRHGNTNTHKKLPQQSTLIAAVLDDLESFN